MNLKEIEIMQLILCIFSSKYLKFDSRFLFSPLQFDWFHQFFFLRENILIHPAHHFSVRFSSKCIDGPKKKRLGRQQIVVLDEPTNKML